MFSRSRAARGAGGLAAGLLWLTAAAQAAQPLATQDAAVKAAGECEWESALVHERAGGTPWISAASTQLGCGMGLASELAVAAGHSRADGQAASVWALAGKTALRMQAPGAAGIALAWSVLADKAPGVPPKAHGWQAGVALSLAAGEAGGLLHLNAAVSHDRPTHRTRASWALAGEQPLAGGLDLTAETFGTGSDPASAALGVRWAAHRQFVLGLARMRCLCGAGGGTATLTATLAF